MRCSRIQELYDDYTCSALAPAQMAAVEEHLSTCEECRAFFAEMESLGTLLRKGDEVGHPGIDYFDRLANKVMVRVESAHDAADADPAVIIDATPSAWLRPARWAGALAAAALLAVAVLPLLDQQSPVQVAQSPAPPAVPVAPESAVAAGPAPLDPAATPVVLAQVEPQGRRMIDFSDTPLKDVLTHPYPGETAPQRVDKGITGISTNDNNVEELMKSPPITPGLKSHPAEKEGRADYEQKLVARRASDSDALSKDITERIRQVREQMSAGASGETLLTSLGDLQRMVGDNAQLQGLSFIKQTRLYLKANEAMEAGRMLDASKFYIQLRMSDENSPIARRAGLHLADLYYGEYADFAKAREYYALATRPESSKVLSENEREHARLRLDRLERYAAQGWGPLQRLHALRKGESMDEVRTSLRSLADSPAAPDLMPEAAGIIVERLRLNPSTNAGLTVEFYKLIEAQASSTSNAALRASLELALGDLAMDQFKDLRLAIDHYRRSADSSADSEAAGVAREKLRTLDDQYFVNLVR